MSVISYVGMLKKPECAPLFISSEEDPADYATYGFYLEDKVPGFRTVSVTGRESQDVDMKTEENDISDGDVWINTKLKARDITVNFAITTDTKQQLISSFTQLRHQFFNVNYDMVRIIFNDDDDYFYEGYFNSISMDPIDASGSGVYAANGSYTIHCPKPLRYSVKEYEVDSDANGLIRVDYTGTYPSYPRFELTNSANNGAIIISDQYSHVLLFGDVNELDSVRDEGVLTLNHDFEKEQSTAREFALDKGTAVTSTGYDSIGIGLTGAKLTYGTGGDLNNQLWSPYLETKPSDKIGNKPWAGAGTRWSVMADMTDTKGVTVSKNFDLLFGTTLLINKHDQNGGHMVNIINQDGKPIMGMLWFINNLSDVIECRYLIGNTYVGDQVLYGHADNGGAHWERNGYKAKHRMSKRGDTLTWHYYLPYSVKLRPSDQQWLIDSKAMYIQYIQFGLETGKFPLPAIRCLRYINFTSMYDQSYDIPNKFHKGTILDVDTSDASVSLDGMMADELGIVGNDWTSFYLVPGQTSSFGFSVSPWSSSKVTGKMFYRRVMI